MREKNDRGLKEADSKKAWKKGSRKSKIKSKLLTETYWPKVIISRDARIWSSSEQASKAISSSYFENKDSSESDNSKEISNSAIIEHLCCDDNGTNFEEEKTICPISSSTEIEENRASICTDCKDSTDFQEDKSNVKISVEHVTLQDSLESNFGERLDYMNSNRSEECIATLSSSTVFTASVHDDEEPIFVDLTIDETNIAWEQTILRLFSNAKSFIEISDENTTKNRSNYSMNITPEPRIMIADSSSRLHRGTTGSIATALKDRGPCVIPVQPNRSLPIRPAPPAPTRCNRKDRSPILKLSNSMILDVVEVEPMKSCSLTGVSLDDDKDSDEQKIKEDNFSKDSLNYVVPQILSVECLNNSKRKGNNENEDEKECMKEIKKLRKSHEADSSQNHDDRLDNVTREYPNNFYDTTVDKGGGILQPSLPEYGNNKRCITSLVVSTTDDITATNKEIANKLVPPLRLKKVTLTEKDTETERESNYRIVTGATPRPESRSISATISSSWSNVDDEENSDFEGMSENENIRNNDARRSFVKSDGYKLKYRRNRLRQKLRELRNKALELATQMANPSTADNSCPYESTRLKQTMNRYEKQIENLSKLLNKLSATIPSSLSDVVNVDIEKGSYENDKLVIVNTNEVKSGESIKRASPCSSPEPPKLSPRSPLDYDNNSSPKEVRNSPPVLPRICLTISTNLDGTNEDLQITDETTWTIDETSSQKMLTDTSSLNEDINGQISQNYDNHGDGIESTTSTSSSKISQQSQCNVLEIDVNGAGFNGKTQSFTSNRPSKIIQYREDGSKIVIDETDKVTRVNLPGHENENKGPIVNFVVGGAEVPANVHCDEAFESTATTCGRPQIPPSTVTNIAQSNYYSSPVTRNNTLLVGVTDDTRNVKKVTTGLNQCVVLDRALSPQTFAQSNTTSSVPNQQRIIFQKNRDVEATQNELVQRTEGRIITEQFPTLGNWAARMSKKVSKTRSKSQAAGAVPIVPTEDTARIVVSEGQKTTVTSANNGVRNNVVNVAPQRNSERWQRQQRQQQFLQQVAASSNTAQSLPAAPILRPNICPPISMTQFYPNGYTIDPYNGAALNYHSAVCPYGTYPYHSRLHPGPPLAGYHLPIQDTLGAPMRPLHHIDKRFAPLQDPIRHFPSDIIKYSGSLSAASFQHPSNLEFDRFRGTSNGNNVGTTSCLSPLLLPPPPPPPPQPPRPPPSLASSAQQTSPRTPLTGYPANNGQYTRNRMIPDVVAAAAAAAVVAAASFDRQRDSLASYTRTDADAMTAAGITGVMDESTHASSNSSKSSVNHDLNNQSQGNVNSYGDETRLNNNGYQQLQNLLLDRLPFIRTAGNFGQSTSFADSQTTTSVVVTTPYKVSPVLSTRGQTSNEILRGNVRNCDTPHLGKVNRSPNTLNNLACSNCGLTGSMFKCLGCENAFYCDERCQTRHWSVHVEKCPKKMPKLKKVA